LNSEQFAKDVFKLCQKVRCVLEREPRVVYLQSPCYIFGDIHGNLEDLHFFSDNIWRLGMSLTAGNFLFLGDYVDRGMSCLEVIAYLMAMKLQLPHKVFLLRGNHETRDVNGWEEHYGERSFIWQCRNRFGDDIGYRIWEACNQVFDRLPLSAVVDQDIFCVHGGIPRPIARDTTRIQDILNVPKVAGINPPYEHEDDAYQQVASDCIWSDPASEQQEMHSVDPNSGFGESLRGGGAICFGNKAVTVFLQQQGFSYIMRAHEAHAEGVAISKQARVFTVFSTSKDHNQGSHALAGCILVDDEKLQVINRSPAYKNQYVHRRDSLSLQSLSHIEIAKRMKLGLVTAADPVDSDGDDEEWQEMESDAGEEEAVEQEVERYTFAQGRRSSINLQQMNENSHDSQVDYDACAGLPRNTFGVSSAMDMTSSSSLNGSSRDLSGLIREVVKENDDDEASTVDGDQIEEKEMEK
jgi:diadenosine tetraphosphatase ApaH/serine/threonine PP2A family protein phosphatase